MSKMLLVIGISIGLVLSSCAAFLVGAAAGGAGAYIMRDQGYKVRSPIEK